VILALHGPGEIVGALGLHARSDRTGRAQTLQTSTVLAWEAAKFEALAERFPALWRNTPGSRNRASKILSSVIAKSRRKSLVTPWAASWLGLLGQVGKPVEGQHRGSDLPRRIGPLTGTTIFTVSRLAKPMGSPRDRKRPPGKCAGHQRQRAHGSLPSGVKPPGLTRRRKRPEVRLGSQS